MKPFATLLFLAGLAALVGGGHAEQRPLIRQVTINPSDLTLQHEAGITTLKLKRAFHGMAEGEPDLPLVSIQALLPEGFRATTARVTPIQTRSYSEVWKIPAVTDGVDRSVRKPAITDGTPTFPANPVVGMHTGHMRGNPIALVTVSPFSWHPGSGELRLATEFRVELEVEPDPGRSYLKIERETPEGRRAVSKVVRTLTGERLSVRHSVAPLAPSTATAFAPTFRPSVDGSPVEMVIITTEEQKAEYQRLADFKTRIGISTVVRTVDWIEQHYPLGVDTQETIRNFIQDAAAKWGTLWVLLGGDSEQIPVRHAFTTWSGGKQLTTDLYYSDLDGNWNANGNALFGEGGTVGSDEVDLFPDVWVGRLTSNNATEAANLVDKTLLYSQNPPRGYQNDLLFLGEVLFPSDWNGGPINWDGGDLCENAIDKLDLHHKPVRLYENYLAFPGALEELKSTVIDSVNAGFNLVHHVGHGFINTMSVGVNHQTLGNTDAETFSNADELFLLYTVNCTSCAIEFNCIGERFLANTGGGAVAVVGSTDLEEVLNAYFIQDEFYALLYGQGVQEIGMTTALSKVPLIGSATLDNWTRWAEFSQICLGDPSLHFWTDVPETLTVSHAPTFELGAGTFAVTVQREGSPVDSARVTLYKSGETYTVGFTDSLGQASLPLNPDSTGMLSVGVFAANSIPYLDSLNVVLPSAPYLVTSSVAIVDDGTGLTNGNGDQRLDAGEIVELEYVLRNNGCVLETGISAVLSSSSPRINILDHGSAFPDLAPGDSASAADPIVLSISRSAMDRLEAPATLSITGASGTYEQDLILYVHAPQVEYWLQSVRDTIGNGNADSTIQANEDFAIIPQIRNRGEGTLRNAEIRLRSSDPMVTITDSVSVVGSLTGGQVGSNPADGLAALFLDVASTHLMEIVVIDAYGEVASRVIDLEEPPGVANLFGQGTDTSIILTWDPSPDPDLSGYFVYRSELETGPFIRVNSWLHRTSYAEDAGLQPLNRYYYRVAAVDSSGNESSLSTVISTSTTLPLHEGWPVDVGTGTPAGVTMADLDGELPVEILGSGNTLYVMTEDGKDFVDGDLDARTLGPLFDSGGVTFWNTPAVGDVDANGEMEVASVGWDGQVHLMNTQGEALPGWPKDGNPQNLGSPNPIGSICLVDLDLNGDMEILCTIGRIVFAWHHTGQELLDGDANPATDGVVAITGTPFSYGTPSAGNLDGDSKREFVAGMRDGKLYAFDDDGTPIAGFPFITGANITSSPAIADIDKDGNMEIIFASSDSSLYAIRSDLSSATGFPRTLAMGGDWDSSPAIGDLNADGFPDVVIASSSGEVHAYSGETGLTLPGFPIAVTDNLDQPVSIISSPVLGDINASGTIDILIGDAAGRLHAFSNTATLLDGFPIQTGNRIENAPLIWDIDGDGLTEVAVESRDQRVYVWDTPWAFNPNLTPWPMFKGNQQHTGNPSDPPLIGVQVGIAPRQPARLLLQNFPNPFARSTAIRFHVPADAGSMHAELRVYDLSGRVIRTLARGDYTSGDHEVIWDGRDNRGHRVASGIYPYRLRLGNTTQTRKMIVIPR